MGEEMREILEELAKVEKIGIQLVKSVREGKFAPVYERKEIVLHCFRNLYNGNNIMLVGHHGVGKNAIVYGMANKIVEWISSDYKVPFKEIVETNPTKLLEGCIYVGNFENKSQILFENCKNNNTVIFLDNVHLGIGMWSSSSSPYSDLINIIYHCLCSYPEVKMICTTTPEGFKILKGEHHGFVNKFIKIEIPPTSREETIEILKEVKQKFEEKYKKKIEDGVIEEIVQLSHYFYRSREFPGKAFELLERVINENLEKDEINVNYLYKYVSKETGLPDFVIDKNKPVNKEEIKKYFHSHIFGQEDAIESITESILKFKTRINPNNKPVSSFLFVGPSGVGKTELAKILAEYLFGSKDKLFIYPMSQYRDIEGFRKLLGTPTYREERYNTGKLLKDVKSSHFSVILFDEIDQASSEVINGLYQILDEGRFIENNGDVTSFESTIIIMATNVGMEKFFTKRSKVGFGSQSEVKEETTDIEKKIEEKIMKFFGEPFINRINKIIIFYPLNREIVKKIVHKTVNEIAKERYGLIDNKLKIELENDVVEFLAEIGYNEIYGARNIQRVIENYCIKEIAIFLAKNPSVKGRTLHFKMEEGIPKLVIE